MKVLTQKSDSLLTEPHFRFAPSFGPYVLTLRNKMEEASVANALFYRHLIKKFQQEPSLLIPFENVEVLEEHEDLIQLLQMSLMPLSADSENFSMALAFIQPNRLFYYTPSFRKTFLDEQVKFDTEADKISHLRFFIKIVLQRCYQVETENPTIIKQVYSQQNHTIRHHEIRIESSFIQVHCDGVLPPYDTAWVNILQAPDENFTALFNEFPSTKFTLEGFCMMVTEDVSRKIAINHLQDAVLHMHTTDLDDTLRKIEIATGELLYDLRIVIGVTPFFKINGKVVYDRSSINKCVGISTEEKRVENGITIQDIYNKFAANPQPYIVSNVNDDYLFKRPYLSGLRENAIKSLLVLPIKTRDGLLGLFEAGSSQDAFISAKTADILQPAIPLITDLIYYMIEIFDSKIDRLVKEKFTPLQKSVEWKFNEVAWEYMLHEQDNNPDEVIGTVTFEQVHPLYGAVDIRDSSIQRNMAVRNDFINQLRTTLDLLDNIAKRVTLPLAESIHFKCSKYMESLHDTLTADDELHISEFFSEALVFFKYISNRYPEFSKSIDAYVAGNHPNGEFHQNHVAYENSFQKINKKILSYYEEEIERLQFIYPFYFERYRTDGVEYNIYIGQSICPDQPFNSIYLTNIRLWQVTAMARVAISNRALLGELQVPMQTTQLILVHGQPIDISFRKDERRFDVEGSYNIRYEMLKKRIDKVRIKHTEERLTQPDKIAIVYSNSADVEEYLQHIKFLQDKGVLADNVEMLELENLQGVIGLKALRVGIT